MLNNDKLNKLFVLATGKEPTQAVRQRNQNSKKRGDSIKMNYGKYTGAYSDPYKAWTNWYRDSKKDLDSDNADDVWDFAEKNFPGSPEQARGWLKNDVVSSSENQDPAIKDINLRENLSKSPSWLASEMLPEVDKLSATVSNQNMTKAKTVFQRSVMDKLAKVDLTQLDPDVAVEEHVADLIRMETAGIADSVTVVNGRFAGMGPNGKVMPAFALGMNNSSIGNGPEMEEMFAILLPTVKPVIESALSNNRSMMGLNNQAARGATVNMLKNGDMPISEWQNAISMLGDPDGVIDAGISGLVNKNPNMSREQAIMNAVEIDSFRRGYK